MQYKDKVYKLYCDGLGYGNETALVNDCVIDPFDMTALQQQLVSWLGCLPAALERWVVWGISFLAGIH